VGAHLAQDHVPVLEGFFPTSSSNPPPPVPHRSRGALPMPRAGACRALPEPRAADPAAHRHPGDPQPLGEEEEGEERPVQLGFVRREEDQRHAGLRGRQTGLSALRRGAGGGPESGSPGSLPSRRPSAPSPAALGGAARCGRGGSGA